MFNATVHRVLDFILTIAAIVAFACGHPYIAAFIWILSEFQGLQALIIERTTRR